MCGVHRLFTPGAFSLPDQAFVSDSQCLLVPIDPTTQNLCMRDIKASYFSLFSTFSSHGQVHYEVYKSGIYNSIKNTRRVTEAAHGRLLSQILNGLKDNLKRCFHTAAEQNNKYLNMICYVYNWIC